MTESKENPKESQSARKRFRGRLFIAVTHDEPGDDQPILTMYVCVDFLTACFWIGDSPAGEILLVMPGEGRIFRDFLAGGPVPFPTIPTGVHPTTIVAALVAETAVSKSTARACVHAMLREWTGAGAEIFRDRAFLPKVWK